ncbi:Uncharacterised protein [Mycolicibacterium aurum]|uniref:Uncharacterized protein n=1 Tax=Mycolicibacterium aurum TaxID=1791 RepID=A0A3S4SE82_MYCAU|nr:hypothetical protein [Mycolicibacterium aurum]VEG51246.1 Uncharacterised protein [Mycolicibacterium aurum]
MTQPISRFIGASAIAAAAVAGPLLAAVNTSPPTSTAQCPAGQTGVIYGCSPFCLPGKYLDTQTGLCMPVPPPPPPAPRY